MMRRSARIVGALAAACVMQGTAAGESDPFQYRLQTRDAERFAELFERTGGKPTAGDLQRHYLDGSGRGVEIFTPGRIVDASNLAARVAQRTADYRHAIDACLPMTSELDAELRAVYLAYRGLLPGHSLPEIYLVFGAGNSGGTAASDAQVLGLEVACRAGTSTEEFRRYMRTMFAHETAHTWQPVVDESGIADLLLFAALREGTPDYLAALVTGTSPDPEREAWARPRERELWEQFQRDRQAVIARASDDFGRDSAAGQGLYRWFANYGAAPDGWPSEAGYWVGMQIASAYVAGAANKRRAIEDLLELKDPQAILAASGYRDRMEK